MSVMNTYRATYILIFLCAAITVTNAQRTNTGMSVTRDGYASVIEEDIASAREEALTSALRGAIEEIMESMVDSEYLYRYARLVERHIFSDVIAYILKYEVLKEGEVDAKSYTLRLRADVDQLKLEEDLDRIGVLQNRLSSPDIVLLITERLPETKLMKKVQISETVIRGALIKSGLILISGNMRIDGAVQNEMRYTYGDDIGEAIEMGNALGGDIVVIGFSEVTLSEQTVRKNSEIKNIVASINLKAVKLDNGIVLAESSASAVYPHSNLLKATERAIGKASIKVVKKLSDEIHSKWKTEVNAGRQISLNVTNVTNFSQFNNIKSTLKYYLTGHVEVNSRSFDGSSAEYSVTASSTGNKMASELDGKIIDEFNIEIISSSLHALSIALVRQ